MPLETFSGTFLTSKEAASHLGVAYNTFVNRRTAHGDHFLYARRDIIPGRSLYLLADVERVAVERR